MQESGQLDELDYSLVNALQIAPRAPWSVIGEVLGISPVTAARRWERLTDEGHAWMTGYCSPTLMRDMPYVLVTLGCVAGSVLQVADALLDDPHAVTISHTVGSSDLTLWGTGRQAGPPSLLSPVDLRFRDDIRAREGGPRCLSTSESTFTASVPRWR